MDIERQIFYNKFHQVLRENLLNGNVCGYMNQQIRQRILNCLRWSKNEK